MRSEKDHRKACTLCAKPRDVLVRCQIDETGQWHFVCPGTCWKRVSGGVIDGDDAEQHEFYRYGGMWKNKHEAVSANKPKKSKKKTISNRTTTLGSDEDQVSAELEAEDEQGTEASAVTRTSLWQDGGVKYTKNDQVTFEGEVWICRKSHRSDEKRPPDKAYSLWKEQTPVMQEVE